MVEVDTNCRLPAEFNQILDQAEFVSFCETWSRHVGSQMNIVGSPVNEIVRRKVGDAIISTYYLFMD
jgi:hypothetical protein